MVDVLQLDFVSGRKAVAYWEIRLFCGLNYSPVMLWVQMTQLNFIDPFHVF